MPPLDAPVGIAGNFDAHFAAVDARSALNA
jgi:hypothetical protein